MRSKSRSEKARLDMLGRVGSVPGGGGRASGDKNRATHVAPIAVLAVVVTLGITLGILHNRWTAQGRSDPSLTGVRTLLFPFQTVSARAVRGTRTGWGWIFPYKDLTEENAHLTSEVARLKQENEALQADAAEAVRLRDALGFVRKEKHPPLIAEVIGLLPSPNSDSIIVARGTRDSVSTNMVARTADGLIGQVTQTSLPSSQIMLLTDTNSSVGGVVMRKGKQMGVGIIHGQGRFKPLQMVYLKREDDIRPGDTVVSSGYGGIFPPGIPVGVVRTVITEKQGFLKSAVIEPAAPQPGALREVFLLRSTEGS